MQPDHAEQILLRLDAKCVEIRLLDAAENHSTSLTRFLNGMVSRTGVLAVKTVFGQPGYVVVDGDDYAAISPQMVAHGVVSVCEHTRPPQPLSLDLAGVDPATSRMLSERSPI